MHGSAMSGDSASADGDTPTVGWLVNTADFGSASVRYRCAHPLANLALRGMAGRVYTKADALLRELGRLDAVVVVKRLDPSIVGLVCAAADAGKPVYVDLCDDLLSEDARSEQLGLPQAALRAVAPLLAAILCPTQAMRSRIQRYLLDNQLANVDVQVLPDCIETDDTYAISEAVWQRTPGVPATAGRAAAPVPRLAPDEAPVRLCWFGNWGGPHSDFGLMSLLPTLARLHAYPHRHELSLHIVSNHAGLADALRSRARFPVTYHPWSREVLSALLARTHFTLITSGDDQFSAIKSPNRALLSLASGVPVIVEAGAEAAGSLWAHRDDTPSVEKVGEILGEAREQGYAGVRERMLAAAAPALERYRLARLGSLYAELLGRALAARARPVSLARVERVAHVFGADEDLGLALEVRARCAAREIEFVAITGLEPLTAREPLFDFFAERGIKPSVVVETEAEPAETRRLRGADIVVQASGADDALGGLLRQWCASRGVRVMSQGEFLYRFP